MTGAGGWTARRQRGTTAQLHALVPEADSNREVWEMRPQDTALVLGSAQPAGDASAWATGPGAASVGAGVVRRRSGGGAVVVVPADTVWIDVVIGRGDPLWDDDVNRAPLWLGQAWAVALASLGIRGDPVAERFEPGRWGKLVCFAGRGPGEVLVDGAKAVGLAQRRTRDTTRFQTMVYRRWDPELLLSRLALPAEEIDDLRAALTTAAFPVERSGDEILAALLSALPA